MHFPKTRRQPCPTRARGTAQASCDREGDRTTDRPEKCGWAPGRPSPPTAPNEFLCQALRPSALQPPPAGQPWCSAPTAKGRSLPQRARFGLRPVGTWLIILCSRNSSCTHHVSIMHCSRGSSWNDHVATIYWSRD